MRLACCRVGSTSKQLPERSIWDKCSSLQMTKRPRPGGGGGGGGGRGGGGGATSHGLMRTHANACHCRSHARQALTALHPKVWTRDDLSLAGWLGLPTLWGLLGE